MAVAIYARVSTTRQADNELSIPDQLKQLRAWCASQGHDIADEFVEPGASATDDRRPAFQRMIGEATASPAPYTAIVVHSRSRFFRELYEFLKYERMLLKAGVKVLSITQQTTDDASGEMASKLFSLFDEYQSKENAKHTSRAMQENARQGYWNGSVSPFGYRAVATGQAGTRGRVKKRLEIDPAEAEMVMKVYDLYLHGRDGNVMGMKAIAAHLNQQGITMRGRPWRIQKVNAILSDSLYTGCYYFNRRDTRSRRIRPTSEWIPVEIPAIIADHLFERVAKRRSDNNPKKHAPRAASSPAPLVGILKCGHCGAAMTQATGKSGKYRYYKCVTRMAKQADACDGRNLPREKTDNLVLRALAEKVLTPERVGLMLKEFNQQRRARSTVEDGRLLKLTRALSETEAAQARLFEAVEKDLLPRNEALRARAHKLEARRSEILLEQAQLKDYRRTGELLLDNNNITALSEALKGRFTDPSSGLGKAWLRLIVDEIRLEGAELKIRGSYDRLAQAYGLLEKKRLGEVPSLIPHWRPVRDSNPRTYRERVVS